MKKLPISVLIPTRNEALNLPRTLNSLRGSVDQICVIDSESTDGTRDIAAAAGCEVYELAYEHGKIIPWILQWALDHLPLRNEWVLILEADRELSTGLVAELQELFAQDIPPHNGYYIRRQTVFRGHLLRYGGYGSKYLLTLFRRSAGQLDPAEEDTRVYVEGTTGRLKHSFIENNLKEAEILFYLQKHLRYAQAFAVDEFHRRQSDVKWKLRPTLFGSPDQRILWLKTLYYRLPLYVRPFLYFTWRYFFRLGILDGKQGAIFHFLQAFWFRLIVDIRIEELIAEEKQSRFSQETQKL